GDPDRRSSTSCLAPEGRQPTTAGGVGQAPRGAQRGEEPNGRPGERRELRVSGLRRPTYPEFAGRVAIPHDPEAQETHGAAPQTQGDLPALPLPAARVGGPGHQPDPSGVGALLPDRQLERLLRLREALGGTEGPAARDAGPGACGLRLAEVEY